MFKFNKEEQEIIKKIIYFRKRYGKEIITDEYIIDEVQKIPEIRQFLQSTGFTKYQNGDKIIKLVTYIIRNLQIEEALNEVNLYKILPELQQLDTTIAKKNIEKSLDFINQDSFEDEFLRQCNNKLRGVVLNTQNDFDLGELKKQLIDYKSRIKDRAKQIIKENVVKNEDDEKKQKETKIKIIRDENGANIVIEDKIIWIPQNKFIKKKNKWKAKQVEKILGLKLGDIFKYGLEAINNTERLGKEERGTDEETVKETLQQMDPLILKALREIKRINPNMTNIALITKLYIASLAQPIIEANTQRYIKKKARNNILMMEIPEIKAQINETRNKAETNLEYRRKIYEILKNKEITDLEQINIYDKIERFESPFTSLFIEKNIPNLVIEEQKKDNIKNIISYNVSQQIDEDKHYEEPVYKYAQKASEVGVADIKMKQPIVVASTAIGVFGKLKNYFHQLSYASKGQITSLNKIGFKFVSPKEDYEEDENEIQDEAETVMETFKKDWKEFKENIQISIDGIVAAKTGAKRYKGKIPLNISITHNKQRKNKLWCKKGKRARPRDERG